MHLLFKHPLTRSQCTAHAFTKSLLEEHIQNHSDVCLVTLIRCDSQKNKLRQKAAAFLTDGTRSLSNDEISLNESPGQFQTRFNVRFSVVRSVRCCFLPEHQRWQNMQITKDKLQTAGFQDCGQENAMQLAGMITAVIRAGCRCWRMGTMLRAAGNRCTSPGQPGSPAPGRTHTCAWPAAASHS